jgi:putative protein-disulfide isomerase
MNQYTVYYCYDAYCGWCYGFSPVIRQLANDYREKLFFEVLSGGMILPDSPRPISAMAGFIEKEYRMVEDYTGVRFGKDYLWHIENPELSDWFPNSEKPAIALCVFKEYLPAEQVAFAADLQYALHYEGRDLCDDEAYRHLVDKYRLPQEEFYERLHSTEYREKAYYEFALVKQLQVTGFPSALLQADSSKFYLVSRGYAHFEMLKQHIDSVLKELNNPG